MSPFLNSVFFSIAQLEDFVSETDVDSPVDFENQSFQLSPMDAQLEDELTEEVYIPADVVNQNLQLLPVRMEFDPLDVGNVFCFGNL